MNSYIKQVLDEKILTGEFIKFACERQLKDMENQGKSWFPFIFSEEKALRAIRFAEVCYHWKGRLSGKPIVLEPNQIFHFSLLYGWVVKDHPDRQDGTRRFLKSFKSVGRKNAKTTEAAIRALFHLKYDGEHSPHVYAGATKEAQAAIVVNDAGRISQISPKLRSHFKVYYARDIIKRVVLSDMSGFIAPLGRDSDTQDGLHPSQGIIDEYHAHPTSKIHNVIQGGMSDRLQPLMDIITTAGFNKDAPCYSQTRKAAIEVLRGIKEDNDLLALIYELDENDDWHDEKNWIKANPNIGVCVDWSYLHTRYKTAENEAGEAEIEFKTKNMNLWTDSFSSWISDAIWIKNKKKVTRENLKGRDCFSGLDLSERNDATFVTHIFPLDSGYFDVLTHGWIPHETAKRYLEKYNTPWFEWADKGFVTITDGNTVDHELIELAVYEDSKDFKIQVFGYDPWQGRRVGVNLQDKYNIRVDEYAQVISHMSEPTKEWGSLVYDGKLNHGMNPVLRWMMGNVVIYKDANGNIKVHKGKSEGKVDGIIAGIIALGEYLSIEKANTTENPMTVF